MSREQLRQFIKENNLKTAPNAKNALKELLAETLQEMLEVEMDDSLGYAKNDAENKQTINRRNGHSKKQLKANMAK
ncbi:MAG: transposase [Peptococcaceae bacterium]|nr:transposase [Peptococcaceae bacterium]